MESARMRRNACGRSCSVARRLNTRFPFNFDQRNCYPGSKMLSRLLTEKKPTIQSNGLTNSVPNSKNRDMCPATTATIIIVANGVVQTVIVTAATCSQNLFQLALQYIGYAGNLWDGIRLLRKLWAWLKQVWARFKRSIRTAFRTVPQQLEFQFAF